MPGTDPLDELTPEILLRAYAMGIFPMSDGRDDPEIHWVDPRRRGIMPLDGFHLSRSLARHIRHGSVRGHGDRGLRRGRRGLRVREETWISHRIQTLYANLHSKGHRPQHRGLGG